MALWSVFRLTCLFHALIDVVMGSFMVISVSTLSKWTHGANVTDQLYLNENDIDEKSRLIQTSESLVGMMLIFIAILLYMVSHLEQIAFQRYFSKGCILIHILLATWRIFVESQVDALKKDVQGQIITDIIFAGTWCFVFLFTKNIEKLQKD